MLCNKCKKRTAVIFITRMDKDQTINEGLCIKCAKQLGLKPISDVLDKLDIDEDELELMNDQLGELIGDVNTTNGEGFSYGGAPSMSVLDKIMGRVNPSQNKGKEQGNKNQEASKNQTTKTEERQKYKYLETYCQNLTQKASEGKIDNIIGREKEMLRVIQILNRRNKNNPCLIGEPGVGKTAIAEGIALKIVNNQVPSKIADKEIYLLDLTALVAGTQFRGQFESRVKGLIEEVKKIGNIILVIDEVHNLVGTGDAEGSMNAANMLKPALSRGEIQVIGATTLTEYRKYIEKDAALERRFQPVLVNEPSIEETIEMLEGIKVHYETYHNIKVPHFLITKAVEMSERYITDRYLPDKAIDLLDEACSNATLKNPIYEELFNCEKNIIEEKAALEELEGDIGSSEDDFMKIADIKASICREEEKLADLKNRTAETVVTLDDLVLIIELWSGIPAAKIRETEGSKLNNLEKALRSRIVGQDKAITAITNAVRRSRVSLIPRKRPVSFIFTGPTGVGKTELVKVLAKELFNSPETLIRLDMSEFMEKHSVSRIIGAPPGYVGYDEAGQLTEKIRRKPYSVILFDEIEKAHPDVLNILLQVLDDGKITDAHGRTVSFEHTIIVMTSNAGSNIKSNPAGFNKTGAAISEEKAKKALTDFLRPEFLNRVDEIIAFSPLPKEIFTDIVKISLIELKEGLTDRGIDFECSDKAIKLLAEKSFSVEYGARNVRRTVQTEIEDKAVNLICETSILPKKILIDEKEGQITVDFI